MIIPFVDDDDNKSLRCMCHSFIHFFGGCCLAYNKTKKVESK